MTAPGRSGDRISALMQTLRLSQNELADGLEVSQSFVSDISRGLKKPGWEVLEKLRGRYGVNINWLLHGDGAMFGDAIHLELFKLIAALVEVAAQALLEEEPEAHSLVQKLLSAEDPADRAISSSTIDALSEYEPLGRHPGVTALVYNQVLANAPPGERVRYALNSAAALFRQFRKLNLEEAMKQGIRGEDRRVERETTRGPAQAIRGRSVRVAGRDYIEMSKTKPKTTEPRE